MIPPSKAQRDAPWRRAANAYYGKPRRKYYSESTVEIADTRSKPEWKRLVEEAADHVRKLKSMAIDADDLRTSLRAEEAESAIEELEVSIQTTIDAERS